LGKKDSKETRLKKGIKSKERWEDPSFRNRMTTHLRDINVKYARKRDAGVALHNKLIDEELKKLEKQGFRCINVGASNIPKPDIIAVKNGKVYAIEVETLAHKLPNYDKWNNTNIFDDIIWSIRSEDK